MTYRIVFWCCGSRDSQPIIYMCVYMTIDHYCIYYKKWYLCTCPYIEVRDYSGVKRGKSGTNNVIIPNTVYYVVCVHPRKNVSTSINNLIVYIRCERNVCTYAKCT